MNEINWVPPDINLTYNQTLVYKSTSKYGTYSTLVTLSDIRITQYIDTAGTTANWYKIRFYDSTNSIYSAYSAPMPASSTVSNINYTTPKKVAFHLNDYRPVVGENIGTGTGAVLVFGPAADPKIVADTETVYVDGTAKIRNVDYTVNYDTGVVTFAAGSAPTTGKAVTMDYWANAWVINSRVIDAIQTAEDEINRNLRRTYYQPQQVTEYVDSFDPLDTSPYSYEARSYSDMTQDYQPKMNAAVYSRLIKMAQYPISTISQIIMNAQPTDTSAEVVGTGNGVLTGFALDNAPVVYGSEKIYVAGVQVTNYTMNYTTGAITFTGTPPTGAITADYTYCTSGVVVSASDYLVRNDSGLIYLKATATQIKQNPFICAVTYTYGYDQVPNVIEHLATLHAAVEIMLSTIIGAPQPQDVLRSNVNTLRKEIDDIYASVGKVMDITRI